MEKLFISHMSLPMLNTTMQLIKKSSKWSTMTVKEQTETEIRLYFLNKYCTDKIEKNETNGLFFKETSAYLNNMFGEVNPSDPFPESIENKYCQIFQSMLKETSAEQQEKSMEMITRQFLSKETLINIWQQSLKLSLPNLSDICLQYFCENITSENTEIIQRMTLEILIYILKSEKTTLSEIELFKIMATNTNGMTTPSLLAMINFYQMTSQELVEIVKPTALLSIETYVDALEYVSTKIKKAGINYEHTARCTKYVLGLGHYNKTYPGYEMIMSKDVTREFEEKLDAEMKKHGGIVALDTLQLNYRAVSSSILRTESDNIRRNQCLLQVGGDNPNGIILKGIVCPIIDSKHFTARPFGFGIDKGVTGYRNEFIAFFVKKN